MATLSKSGITTGQSVESWHITQSIDAFSGLEAYDISLSGSFNMTGSINGEPGVINNLTASYATTASYALNTVGSGFPFSGSAVITGSLLVSGSTTAHGGLNVFDSNGITSLRISGNTTKILLDSSEQSVLDFENSELQQDGVSTLDWNPGYKGVHISQFLQLSIVSTPVNPNSLPSGSIMLSGSADDYNMYVNMAGGWKQIAFV